MHGWCSGAEFHELHASHPLYGAVVVRSVPAERHVIFVVEMKKPRQSKVGQKQSKCAWSVQVHITGGLFFASCYELLIFTRTQSS
jgi:hypothetical protein